MRCYLVISPASLEKKIKAEAQRLVKKVYAKKVNNIYYRVKTKEKLDNPRRLFIKGDGRVLEGEIKPHISLVHNIELNEENKDKFIKSAGKICNNHKPSVLEFEASGNHDMDFTFFLKFKDSPKLTQLRSDLLALSKSYVGNQEYNQHIKAKFIPHSTLLYDDIDPQKVNKAYSLLNTDKFQKPVSVKEIQLWQLTSSGQKVIAKLPLKVK